MKPAILLPTTYLILLQKFMHSRFFKKYLSFFFVLSTTTIFLFANEIDSNKYVNAENVFKKIPIKQTRKFNPKTAALLSAVLPGSGQIYNQKYWKVPIVYGVMGWVIYDIYDSYQLFNKLSAALIAFNKAANKDSADFKQVDPVIQKLSITSVQNYKNSFRKQIDESSLWLLVVWGLNVIDAGVDAHLKSYDVSDNLSLKFQPQILPEPISNKLTYNFKISLNIKSRQRKSKFLLAVAD